MGEPTDLIEKAAREITDRHRRKNGIPSELEGAVLFSSRQIARNAYRTALQMYKDMPKKPDAMELPKIPDGLDADTRAEFEKLGQRLLEGDRERSARRHADMMEMTRDLVTVLFKTVGISDKTASELTSFIFSRPN